MSHGHGNDCHDEHDHTHDTPLEDVVRETLYQIIDHDNVQALNAGAPARITKPWHERLDDTVFLESDADAQLIIKIPLLDSQAKLVSLLLKAGPGDHTPTQVKLFVNEDNLDFDDIEGKTPAQEFEIPQSSEVGEYALKPSKFSNVRVLTLFIPDAQGADTSRISYVGLTGSYMKLKGPPVVVYEARPQLKDHKVDNAAESVAKQQF